MLCVGREGGEGGRLSEGTLSEGTLWRRVRRCGGVGLNIAELQNCRSVVLGVSATGVCHLKTR